MSRRFGTTFGTITGVVALSLVLGSLVALGAAGVADASVPCTSRTLVVVAHEDDDLLFLNPDVYHDIQAGACVKTVYITAGDYGRGKTFWLAREAGAEASSASLAGVADVWKNHRVSTSGGTAHIATLVTHPQIKSEFLRLPDDGCQGGPRCDGRFPMSTLWSNPSNTAVSVDGRGHYTRNRLLHTLENIITSYHPDVIRIQDRWFQPDDHIDHQMAARFASAAATATGNADKLVYYVDYPISSMAQNVFGSDFDAKSAAWIAYSHKDGANCNLSGGCNSLSDFDYAWPNYVAAEYHPDTIHPRQAIYGVQQCVGGVNGDGLASSWQCDDADHLPWIWVYDESLKHLVDNNGDCLQSSGTNAIFATCTSAAEQQWSFDEFGGYIRDSAGDCLTAGNPMTLAACFNTDDQLWAYGFGPIPRRELVNQTDGNCLEVQGSGTAAGTPVQDAACTGADNQLWRLTFTGAMVGYGNNCLQLPSPHNAGTQLVMEPCNGGHYQRWHSSDLAFVSFNNLCVSFGAPTTVRACTGYQAQDWAFE